TAITGPEQPPFVFGSVAAGGREISFNDQKAIPEDCPALGAKPSAAVPYARLWKWKGSTRCWPLSRKAAPRSPCGGNNNFIGCANLLFRILKGRSSPLQTK